MFKCNNDVITQVFLTVLGTIAGFWFLLKDAYQLKFQPVKLKFRPQISLISIQGCVIQMKLFSNSANINLFQRIYD